MFVEVNQVVQVEPDTASAHTADAAGAWEDWGQSSLATAAVMEEVAAEHLEAASEWAAYGDVGMAREELAEAHIASELGAESAAIAQAEFEIAGEYREHGNEDANAPGATDSNWLGDNPHDAGANDSNSNDSYDSVSSDSGSYDSGSTDSDQDSLS